VRLQWLIKASVDAAAALTMMTMMRTGYDDKCAHGQDGNEAGVAVI